SLLEVNREVCLLPPINRQLDLLHPIGHRQVPRQRMNRRRFSIKVQLLVNRELARRFLAANARE
ncbi:MAG TPA: hypothetical protein VFO40_26610, partial [Chthoniobacterales bacterium]|nr:hypothetical protein [Chthoniobacterales bacterium]